MKYILPIYIIYYGIFYTYRRDILTNKKLKKVALTSILTAMLASSFTISNAESYKVFIDAGHGGKDNGSSHNGYLEDVLNLQIAQKLKNKLINVDAI